MDSEAGKIDVCLRPDSVYLLLHTNLFLLESSRGLSPFLLHMGRLRVRFLNGTACRSPRNDLDIPELHVVWVQIISM